MKSILFTDQDIGYDSLEFVVSNYKNSLVGVVTLGDNEIARFARENGIRSFDFNDYLQKWSVESLPATDYIILAWWPKIVKEDVINFPKVGVINFHPSFLPFNKGKNYNFWTLVEECTFGVTLHFVDEGIDTGEIIFQKEIAKSWEDTGETLYFKGRTEMLQLFKDNYSNILIGNYEKVKQNRTAGSFHYSKELDKASELSLDKMVKTRDILNLLRARTFDGMPACYFTENGEKYEVKIEIKKQINKKRYGSNNRI